MESREPFQAPKVDSRADSSVTVQIAVLGTDPASRILIAPVSPARYVSPGAGEAALLRPHGARQEPVEGKEPSKAAKATIPAAGRSEGQAPNSDHGIAAGSCKVLY